MHGLQTSQRAGRPEGLRTPPAMNCGLRRPITNARKKAPGIERWALVRLWFGLQNPVAELAATMGSCSRGAAPVNSTHPTTGTVFKTALNRRARPADAYPPPL